MTKTFEQGDRVSWNTSQGTTRGKVVERLTSDTKIQEHQVRASETTRSTSSRARGRAPARLTSRTL